MFFACFCEDLGSHVFLHVLLFQEIYFHQRNKSRPTGFIEYRLWTIRKRLTPTKKRYSVPAKKLKATVKAMRTTGKDCLMAEDDLKREVSNFCI